LRSSGAAAWRFSVVGLINTALGYLLFLALALALPPAVAYITSYCIGIVFAVIANLRWTFRRKLDIRAIALSSFVYVVTMTAGTLLIIQLGKVGLDLPITGLAVTVLGVAMNFVGLRLIARRIGDAQGGAVSSERQSP
jgi:putative flippase GtrA